MQRAAQAAQQWLDSVPDRAVPPRASPDELTELFGGDLPRAGSDPANGDRPAGHRRRAGLMAIQSGRFYGWVMGGTLPAALAADWLVSGAQILNAVDYTQVCVAFGTDERTRAVTQRVIADGRAWMSGSRWHDQDVLRISVSNWTTDADDVRESVAAVAHALQS